MKKLLKLFCAVTLSSTSILSVACGGDNRATTLTIFADGENDAKALQKIGEDFLKEYEITDFKIKSLPVDMKSTSSLMVSNPRMVKTDLYNMPHDYIGNLHSTKAMTNLNDIKLNEQSANLSRMGIAFSDGKMISPNGKVMATEWPSFVESVNKAWTEEEETYGKPVSKTAIEDIAIYETQGGESVRFDYIWPSTFQTNMTELNMKKASDLTSVISDAKVNEDGSFNFDARDLINAQVASGKWSGSDSSRQWNNELFFNDFKADFVTSAFLMELPKIQKEDGSDYYSPEEIKILDSSGTPFYDGTTGKSSKYIREQFENHWTGIFNWLIDNNYSKNKELPDYEANAKILKGEFGKGNLFMWNIATWDMSGASKEFKPTGSLTAGNGKVDLKFGQPVKWNKENNSNPLMMIGGLGVYQLATHKELSMAFLQYLARKESSYTWMKNSRGMMFDSSAFDTVKQELEKIVNDESLSEANKNSKLVEFFDPIDVDKPYIDTEYVEYWIQGMEQAIKNTELSTIIPSYPVWTSFLGEFASAISALYNATKNSQLDKFKEENVRHYVRQWVKALDPRSQSGWEDDYK